MNILPEILYLYGTCINKQTKNKLTPWGTVLLEKLTSHSVSQEIPCFLWNLKVHFYVHEGLPILRSCAALCSKLDFYSLELLAPCPTPNMEDHLLLAVNDCLFSTFTATLHIWRDESMRSNLPELFRIIRPV